MPTIVCKYCGKEFKRKPSQIKLAREHFCSTFCQHQAKRAGEIKKCFVCEKEVYKSLKDLKNSKSKNYFCSKRCSLSWSNSLHFGSKSVNWKGGKSSYKKILERTNLPKICSLCGKDNIKILSVHHLDQTRSNNDIKNLVWLCQNCHFLVHHYSEEKQKLARINHAN
ncbi:MAG: HNH endonuclease [Candidatus Vogelbacteria bacterium]|nr:HNH endonuclease [Candidatus Vogelbacteria bacterium]